MQITCNKCGCEFDYATDIKIQFNYGSRFNMETWQTFLCDDCIEEIVKTFKLSPQGYGVTGYEDYYKAMEELTQGGLV